MIHVTVRGNRRLLNCQIRFVLIDQHGISQLDNTAKQEQETSNILDVITWNA